MGQSIKTWVGATVFVAFLIGVAGYFLLISPTRAATADTRANIDSESSRAVTLTTALETLKKQFEGLDDSRAALEGVSVQVPTTADGSAYRRVLAERAATSGVTIMSLQTGVPAPVTAPAAPAAGTDTAGTTASATPSPSPSPSPAAEAPATPTNAVTTATGQILVGIPLQMTVVGTYDAARAFIASLQGTEGRLFLVYTFNLAAQSDSPAGGGRPATVTGDVEMSLQGYLVVLTPNPSDAVPTEVTPTPTPSPEPLPSTERNPFVPLAPTTPVG